MVAFLLGRKVCRQGMIQARDDFCSRAWAHAQEFQDQFLEDAVVYAFVSHILAVGTGGRCYLG